MAALTAQVWLTEGGLLLPLRPRVQEEGGLYSLVGLQMVGV